MEQVRRKRGDESVGPASQPLAWNAAEPMVGESRAMCEVRAYVDRVARTDSNVLITG